MKIFVVNLTRRRDRLAAMSAQLRALSLDFERVPACDVKDASGEYLDRYVAAKGPLGDLTKGDRCCFVSHMRAWNTFLGSGAPYGVILEDDIRLGASASDLLRQSDWVPPNVELLKLEHFGPEHQRVLVGPAVDVWGGHAVARIRSRHTGAGAYVLSRAAARTLVWFGLKWRVSVDHVLFNPNVSPVAHFLRPYQLLPAIARQDSELGGGSDIAASRKAQRRLSMAFVKREIVRAYYEIRLLPQQIMSVAAGRARLVCVRNEGMAEPADLRTFADIAKMRTRRA